MRDFRNHKELSTKAMNGSTWAPCNPHGHGTNPNAISSQAGPGPGQPGNGGFLPLSILSLARPVLPAESGDLRLSYGDPLGVPSVLLGRRLDDRLHC